MTSHTGSDSTTPDNFPSGVHTRKTSGSTVHLRVDERPDEYLISAVLPSMFNSSVQIRAASNNYVEIIGTTPDAKISERIQLPEPVTEDKIRTEFNNGVLVIRVHRP